MSRVRQSQFIILILVLLGIGGSGSWADTPSPDLQGGRYALLIGNSIYGGGADDISGVKNADLMAEYLRQLDFEVVDLLHNAERGQMTRALEKLGSRIRDASVVVVFYSGHGFQKDGENYLMPVDGSIFPASSVPLLDINVQLERAPKEAVKLVFLDACRENQGVSRQGLNQKQAPSLPGTLYAFAAGPDQFAKAGSSKDLSPYTTALTRYIREPGLGIFDLLGKVRSALADFGQLPAFLVNGVPSEFSLRKAVVLTAKVDKADDDLIVVLNGKIALNAKELALDPRTNSEKELRLNAGDNEVLLLVSNGRTFHNNHDWDRTEGWSYALSLRQQDGTSLCKENGQPVRCFVDDGESVPFKDGPHHGGVFLVAKANLFVDPGTAEVSLLDREDKIWNNQAPIWAQDQEPLYERRVKDLPLNDILDPKALPNFGAVPAGTVVVLLRSFLTTGSFLGHKIADPEKTSFKVYGNKVFRDSVRTCIEDREPQRIKDLQASITAALKREPRPFSSFDEGLIECLKEVGLPSGLQAKDVKVWTAIEDNSRDPQPTPVAGQITVGEISTTESALPVRGHEHE